AWRCRSRSASRSSASCRRSSSPRTTPARASPPSWRSARLASPDVKRVVMGHGHDHSHSHGHDHGHGHDHAHGAPARSLTIALGLTATYMVVEAVGGLLTGSLALLADAGHMLSDAGALVVALVAARLAERPPDARQTM